MNLYFVISKAEVDRLLKIATDRFRSKKRVNKIIDKIDEVTKESDAILRQFLKEHGYDINLAHDDTQPVEQLQDTSIMEVHTVIPVEKTNVHTTVDDVDQKVDNSDEVEQDPLVIDVGWVKEAEEIGKSDEEKGDVEAKNSDKDVSVEIIDKDKGEEKDDQVQVIVARDTVADKGK